MSHLADHDATQVSLMAETIVVVTPDDAVVGADSKENCTCASARRTRRHAWLDAPCRGGSNEPAFV